MSHQIKNNTSRMQLHTSPLPALLSPTAPPSRASAVLMLLQQRCFCCCSRAAAESKQCCCSRGAAQSSNTAAAKQRGSDSPPCTQLQRRASALCCTAAVKCSPSCGAIGAQLHCALWSAMLVQQVHTAQRSKCWWNHSQHQQSAACQGSFL